MTTKDEALKLALEALGWTDEWRPQGLREEAIKALQEALAEQPVQQEPVAIVDANDEGYWAEILPDRSVKVGQPLYTSPPTLSLAQRTWVHATEWRGLTDEEVLIMSRYDLEYAALIGEVQRKLKEKNSDF